MRSTASPFSMPGQACQGSKSEFSVPEYGLGTHPVMLCCVMAQLLQAFAVLLAPALSNIGPAQVVSVPFRPRLRPIEVRNDVPSNFLLYTEYYKVERQASNNLPRLSLRRRCTCIAAAEVQVPIYQ